MEVNGTKELPYGELVNLLVEFLNPLLNFAALIANLLDITHPSMFLFQTCNLFIAVHDFFLARA